MSLPKVGFDIDGCIANFTELFVKKVNKLGFNLTYDEVVSYYFSELQSLPDNIIGKCTDAALRDTRLINPYHGAFDFLRSYHSKTRCPLVIATMRHEEYRDVTCAWLKEHLGRDIPFTIYFDRSKVDVFFEYELDFFIEDAPHHVKRLLSAGADVIMFKRPWNRKLHNLKSKHFKAVDYWQEVRDIIMR